jgi:hypothetical protein
MHFVFSLPAASLLLGPNILLCTLSSDTLDLYSTLKMITEFHTPAII